MDLSISSSERSSPRLDWKLIAGGALAMLLAYVWLAEMALARKGFVATVSDSETRWLKERARASALGSRALILVGASRIQLDVDLAVLRRSTGLEPVQLAVDGSSYAPVLQGLAADQTIRGTVILDLMPGPVTFEALPPGRSHRYQADYEALVARPFQWPTYRTSEAWLADALGPRLVNYADGGRPWDALVDRLANPLATPQYLSTFPDRSREADYQRVKMPEFYLNRVLRHLGSPAEIDSGIAIDRLTQQVQAYVGRLVPRPESAQSNKGLLDLERAVSAIQSRGGRVFIIAMPTSGLVREADDRRFPRELYWDRMVSSTTAVAIHWQDYPALAAFVCPDGSHLDKRDRAAFTDSLVSAAGMDQL